HPNPWEGYSFPAIAWQIAWAIAAACFVVAVPWRDRRGRRPLRLTGAVVPAVGTLVVLDVALVLLRRSLPHASDHQILVSGPFGSTSALQWGLALPIVVGLVVA